LPAARQAAAIERVAKRYVRVLGVNARDLTAALHASATSVPATQAA
jgi:indole-3-glycerol phosphate synthase